MTLETIETSSRHTVESLYNELEIAQESIADLEAKLADPGWQLLSMKLEREFDAQGRKDMANACRLMAIKNPLIKRGLSIRQTYVWGQGVEINARATESDDSQDVAEVINDFLNDPGNQENWSGTSAQIENEGALGTDGNLFLVLFTDPRNGKVSVRTLPFEEVTEIISNPNDKSEVWYYRRIWEEERFDFSAGHTKYERQEAFYPALNYRPISRTNAIAGRKVHWDAPVLHIRVNKPKHWQYGIPDAYAAIDWAIAFKEFLEDWVRLVKALSRFAWRYKAKSKDTVRQKIAATPSRDAVTGEPNFAGATATMPQDALLEAIPKTGATIDSGSGRPVAMMAAAALDVPVTMLLSDPGVTGARAVAETLDKPMELAMKARRSIWEQIMRIIHNYVIDRAIEAPGGPLKGKVIREGNRVYCEFTDDTERTIDIFWPELDKIDPQLLIDAIVKADSTGYLDPLVIARLLLETLNVRNIDEILEKMTDEDGNYIAPDVELGQAAVNKFREENPTEPEEDENEPDADSEEES